MLLLFDKFKAIIKNKQKVIEIRASNLEDIDIINKNLEKFKRNFPDFTILVNLDSRYKVDNLNLNEVSKFKNHVGQKLKLLVKFITLEEKPTKNGSYMYLGTLELPGKRRFVKYRIFSKTTLKIDRDKYFIIDCVVDTVKKQFIKKNEQMLGKEIDYQLNISTFEEYQFEQKNEEKYTRARHELHAHTKFSKNDAFMDVKDYRKAFEENKVDSLAITDHGVVLAFNEFTSGLKDLKEKGKKLILGCEFYGVDISKYRNDLTKKIELTEREIEDIENSGEFNEIKELENEILALRDERNINKKLMARKTISEEEREQAVHSYEEAVSEITNITSQIKELKENMKTNEGLLIRKKDEIEYYKSELVKPNDAERDHITLLLKTKDEEIEYRGEKLVINKGLVELYKLVTKSYLEYFSAPQSKEMKMWGKRPVIDYSELFNPEIRDMFVINSACAFGRHLKLAVAGEWEEFRKWIKNLDAVEMHPIHNNIYMIEHKDYPNINTMEDLFTLHRKIYEVSKEEGVPVLMVSDAHVNDKEDRMFRSIFKEGYITAIKKRAKDNSDTGNDFGIETQPFIQSYDDIVEDLEKQGFSPAEIEEMYSNEKLIADMCVNAFDITLLPKKLFLPSFPNVDVIKEVPCLAWEFAINKWSIDGTKEGIDRQIYERLVEELDATALKGFEVLYYIAYWMCRKSEEVGYIVGSRGSAGSMILTYALGVGENNPLPPHHLCSRCKTVIWSKDKSLTGLDLADIECPKCGATMEGDGLDIEAHNFTGKRKNKCKKILKVKKCMFIK